MAINLFSAHRFLIPPPFATLMSCEMFHMETFENGMKPASIL